MKDSSPPRKPLSRRDVLKTASLGAMAGAVSTGYAASASQDPPCPEGPNAKGGPAAVRSPIVSQDVLEADVVVVGGGMAGVCAAIAAARNGASVVLVQDRPVLGGNSSSEVRLHVLGAEDNAAGGKTDFRETGILEELRLEEAIRNPQRSTNMWDLLLYEWVRREPNLTCLLNTHCCGARMSGPDRIEAVLASRYGTEDMFTIRGKLFIDCSGDGRLGAEAGAEFRVGREARSEYGESLAPLTADRKVLGSSILFCTRKHDRPMPFVAPNWIRRFPRCEDLPHRGHGSWEWGFWWVEWGGDLDTIKDNERIRDELLAAALGVWDHIKNSGRHPESANWALDWIGSIPGKRENRRFVGDYVLKQQDVQAGETFEDGVAYGGWAIDHHPPAGIYASEPACTQIQVPLYNIPFRSLYSRNIANLMFAGRNISASHVAFGSTRVMATCSVEGQAVGTAAALCARQGSLPRTLARDGMAELQQQLLRDDAYIIGTANRDPNDLARKAKVRASSETAAGPAEMVINGVHRGVFEKSNRWISDPNQPLPQWIELRFDQPRPVGQVDLVFDTRLNHRLSLSLSDRVTKTMRRGPQLECVKDYEIQVLDGESARTVVRVEGNYQRKRVHRFDAATVSGLRLKVNATWGDKSARLFEIRAYA